MYRIRFKTVFRLISFLLAFLLVWQNVVWANPGLSRRHKLQPEFRIFAAEGGRASGSDIFSQAYIARLLSRIEADPESASLEAMRQRAWDALQEIVPDPALTVKLSGQWHEGELVIDVGELCIRYFNPRVSGNEGPGTRYRVIDQRNIGEYITRQILLPEEDHRGMIARGQDGELYSAFVDKNPGPELNALRPAVLRRLRKIVGGIRGRLKRHKTELELSGDEAEALETALNRLTAAKGGIRFREMNPVVLLDEKDPTDPRAWFLGFNTTAERPHKRYDLPVNLYGRLKETHDNTIALTSPALDLIGQDTAILEEYVFHEMLCPYLGHERSRGLAELMFPENYRGITTNMTDQHRDGELGLVLKQVIWEKCRVFNAESLQEERMQREYREFREQDFMASGPQRATIFLTHFKAWQKWQERLKTLNQSRLRAGKRVSVETWRGAMEEQYRYVFARLSWLWEMEGVWTKPRESLSGNSAAEVVGESKHLKDITREDALKVREAIIELLEVSDLFMAAGEWGEYLLQDGRVKDRYIRDTLKRLCELAGVDGTRYASPPRSKSSDSHKPEKDGKRRTQGSSDMRRVAGDLNRLSAQRRSVKTNLKDPFRAPLEVRIQGLLREWPQFLFILTAAGMVTMVLWAVLPVNIYTVTWANIAAVGVFAYVMLKSWSWSRFVMGIGLSVMMWYVLGWLNIPWFGLALALILFMEYVNDGPRNNGVREQYLQHARQRIAARKEGDRRPDEVPDGRRVVRPEAERTSASPYALPRPLQDIMIAHEVIRPFYDMIRRIDPGSESGKYEDLHSVLETVLFFDSQEEWFQLEEAKRRLRPMVRATIASISTGNDYDLQMKMSKIRNVREWPRDTVADALQEVSQEVGRQLVLSEDPAESSMELKAIREIMAEEFRIDKAEFREMKMQMYLALLRERTVEDEITGNMRPHTWYHLGRMEFHFKNYEKARECFEEALRQAEVIAWNEHLERRGRVMPDAVFFFAAGIVCHLLERWDEAVKHYDDGTALFDDPRRYHTHLRGDDTSAISNFRRAAAEELLRMAKRRQKLDGTYGRDEGSPAALLPLWAAADDFMREYAVRDAPVREELIFTVIPLFASLTLSLSGVVGLAGHISIMGACYGLFLALHWVFNRRNIPPRLRGIFSRVSYVLLSPFKITIVGFTISLLVREGLFLFLPEGVSLWFVFPPVLALTYATYAVMIRIHAEVNRRAVSGRGTACATLYDRRLSPLAGGCETPRGSSEPGSGYHTLSGSPHYAEITELIPERWISRIEEEFACTQEHKIDFSDFVRDLNMIFEARNEGFREVFKELWGILGLTRYLGDVSDGGTGARKVSYRALMIFVRTVIRRVGEEDVGTVLTALKDKIRKGELSDREIRQGWMQNPFVFFRRLLPCTVDLQIPPSGAEQVKTDVRSGESVRVLFVCAMNANRSCMLDVLSRDIIRQHPGLGNVAVDSCGVAQGRGNEDLLKAARDSGVPGDITRKFTAKEVSERLLAGADHVVVTDAYVAEHVSRLCPESVHKMVYATDLLPTAADRLSAIEGKPSDGFFVDFLSIDNRITPLEYVEILRLALEEDLFGIEPEEVMVENASERDIETVLRLRAEAFSQAEDAAVRISGDRITSVVRDVGREIMVKVCRRGDDIEGYIIICFEEEHARIEEVVVANRARRRGMARLMVKEAIAAARAAGYRKFSGRGEHPATRSIYRSCGFRGDESGEFSLEVREGENVDRQGEIEAGDRDSLAKNLEAIAPMLSEALRTASLRAKTGETRVVLILDTHIGRGEVNSMIRRIIDALSGMEDNNKDMRRFLSNLEIISGPARIMGLRAKNLTDDEKGSVPAENVIVVTSGGGRDFFSSLEGKAVIAGIDESEASGGAYIPLVEITLFAVGKFLGWDADTLRRRYGTIPNVVPLEKLEEGDALVDPASRSFVFRIVPDAVRFSPGVTRGLTTTIKQILSNA